MQKDFLISYKEIKGINLKYKDKILVVGNILREEILYNLDKKNFKVSDEIKVLVLGGSQAAKVFAEVLPDIFIKCKKKNINFKVYQQCLDNQKIKFTKKISN